jgi:cysteine desulfurase family protein (TIGR01976 family)
VVADLDLDFVRSNFPAFREPSLEGWGFFENAGGSYACQQVIDAQQRYYTETKVQPYYDYPASLGAGEQMDTARQRMAAWLNVGTEEVHFGPSTTLNTYVVALALREHLTAGDEVIVTNQDHEANIGAWRRLESGGVVVREWKVDAETGELNPQGLDALLGARTRMVAFTHCSNIVASINPVREITDKIRASGAISIVDGVSFCPHGFPDVAALGADIYLFSLYKVYGPHLGVMVMNATLNAELPNQGHFFNAGKPAARFTPAGPDHAQIAATNGLIDYLEAVHKHHYDDAAQPAERAARVRSLFRQHETRLLQPLLDFLAARPGVRMIGRQMAGERAPTVSFVVEGHDPAELVSALSGSRLAVGAGHFYAYHLIKALGLDTDKGALRTSFVHYTSAEEVRHLIDVLDQLL